MSVAARHPLFDGYAMTRRQALIAIHIGALMFGLSGVFGKLAESAPLFITFARALFAVLALASAATLIDIRGEAISWKRGAGLVAGGLLLGGHWLTFFIAVKTAGVGIATLGFASFPAFTILLEGVLFRERTRPVEFALVGLVCVGLVLVAPTPSVQSEATLGLLYGVLSGLLFAMLALLNRAVTRGINPIRAALWQNLAIVLVLLPWNWQGIGEVPAMDWLWLAMLGVLCTGLAHSFFVASLRVLNARTTSVIFALEPVYGIAFAWWLFAERPGGAMLFGGAMIILASVIASRLKEPDARPAPGRPPVAQEP